MKQFEINTLSKNEHRRATNFGMSHNTVLAVMPWALFAIQWMALLVLSFIQFHRGSLTLDFAIYHQAWYLIAHGHLNPFDTSGGNLFIKNHFELIMWLMAPFYWVFPSSFFLLLTQDTATILTGVVVWLWVKDLLRTKEMSVTLFRWLSGTALVLIVLNPWFFQANSFDFHFQSLSGLFLVLSLRAFYNNHNHHGVLWALAVLLEGNVTTTYVVGIGLSVILTHRKRWRYGALLVGIALGWFYLTMKLGINLGAGYSAPNGHGASSLVASQIHIPVLSGPIGTVLLHPVHDVIEMWRHRVNIYANISPEGIIGVFSPWSVFVSGIILLENNLVPGSQFNYPGFQSEPIYGLIIFGTMQMVVWLLLRRERFLKILMVGLVLNGAGWTTTWFPLMPQHFIHVSSSAGRIFRKIHRIIPPNAQVISSQGVGGRLAGRPYFYDVHWPVIPVRSSPVYAVIAPYAGIDVSSAAQELTYLQYLVQQRHATIIVHQKGIWLLHLSSSMDSQISIPSQPMVLSAWAINSHVGSNIFQGPLKTWHVTALRGEGYVLNKAYWRLSRGWYAAHVRLSTTGPINVEVWDATNSQLLARRTVSQTNGPQTVSFSFFNPNAAPSNVFHGRGIFIYSPVPGPPDNQIEIRLWTPGHQIVNAYRLSIVKERRK